MRFKWHFFLDRFVLIIFMFYIYIYDDIYAGFFSKNHYLGFVSLIHKLSYDTKFFEYVGDKHKFLVE